MRLLMAAALVLTACPAGAQQKDDLTDTAGGLRSSCLGENDKFGLGLCGGFLDGVRATMELEDMSRPTKLLCRPDDTTRRAMFDSFLGYLKRHPDAESASAVSVVRNAYIVTWGCDKSRV